MRTGVAIQTSNCNRDNLSLGLTKSLSNKQFFALIRISQALSPSSLISRVISKKEILDNTIKASCPL